MPFDTNGVFHPRPWEPLTEPLFGVMPPGHPDRDEPALPEDTEWYRLLRHTTALAIQHIVGEVYNNFTVRDAVAFSGAQLHRLHTYCTVISTVFLDNDPKEQEVNQQLNRLVKTVGLVFHDPNPGRKHNWPCAPRIIGTDDAIQLVDEAFWGRYATIAV